MGVKKCEFCGQNAEFSILGDLDTGCFYECPICGNYETQNPFNAHDYCDKNKTATYLYYNGNHNLDIHNENRGFVLATDLYYKKKSDKIHYRHATPDVIEAFYPKTFSDRITRILLAFAKMSEFIGDTIEIDYEELLSIYCVKRFDKKGNWYAKTQIEDQEEHITDYLKSNKYIDIVYLEKIVCVCLLVDGWKRVDEMQQNLSNNKDVFVSMAFNSGTFDTREAIRNGIINAGYSPEFIDEIIHNRQIVPEMFRLIRECRFLILDISDPNYGAYYEAGYALGLGKEVIICCSREMFNKEFVTEEEKKYAKYLKPHFDIAQKQILVWDDYEDLTKKLEEWIKAIIG